ncbi:pyridoxal phosphate-dependent aminotransferase [Oceaniovalibus sp. ACAM 378]|uniref:pyridoxal phosphate-dependent aminotransferase n=1 Tax=Oceaniovalibus sp. ACAM 378 TaxID=2599923 RepID=UPI0011D4DDF1|nr:pyridoxal phosphate-dependent aminotransferase [Oceaniovalibus sp. ACAM 378]TYB85073.1 pyridoxal phosphate-dependent aminotransferase [Oceaniovalibus sp. ACAM 378]
MSAFLTPHVASLPATVPFVGPEAQERQRGRRFAARIGANESVFGPSPLALAAMQRAAGEVWQYPDPENYDLRQALATLHAIDPGHIQIGEGIDTLLGYLCRMTVAPGVNVVTSDGAYPTFNYHVAGYGGTLHRVPYRDDHEDLAGLLAMVREHDARVLYLSNPDNPMGTWHNAERITDLVANLPDTCLLLLDEAYVECAPAGTAPDIAPDTPNVIRLRTFSKVYGMAGARVGYAIGPRDLIASFDRIRNHFGMTRIAQAGALAALQDQEWLAGVISDIAIARDTIAGIARAHGLTPLPSATNFVTVDCGRDGAFARRVLAGLIDRDIFVRMPFVAPQDRCIRIGCGTSWDMALLSEHLSGALADASSEV